MDLRVGVRDHGDGSLGQLEGDPDAYHRRGRRCQGASPTSVG